MLDSPTKSKAMKNIRTDNGSVLSAGCETIKTIVVQSEKTENHLARFKTLLAEARESNIEVNQAYIEWAWEHAKNSA